MVFIHSLPSTPKPQTKRSPLLLLTVCKACTHIALSTPSLWTAIQYSQPWTEGFKDGLQAWLHRAGNSPLSITLRTSFVDQSVAALIWQHRHQLNSLEITLSEVLCETIYPEGGTRQPGALPLLRSLTLNHPHPKPVLSGSQLTELLRMAPNLTDCHLNYIPLREDIPPMTEKVILPTLRRMIFGEYGFPGWDYEILKYLTLPALETLSVAVKRPSDIGDLVTFLTRSSSPLRELVVGHMQGSDNFMRLVECLRVVPTLTPPYHRVMRPLGGLDIPTPKPPHSQDPLSRPCSQLGYISSYALSPYYSVPKRPSPSVYGGRVAIRARYPRYIQTTGRGWDANLHWHVGTEFYIERTGHIGCTICSFQISAIVLPTAYSLCVPLHFLLRTYSPTYMSTHFDSV